MSLKSDGIPPIPPETIRIAQAACPNGTFAMHLRDLIGTVYTDEEFADIYPTRGQPATAPWRLALITLLQYAEGLSDRQAAQAVGRFLDWKYALSLEVTDAGFDFSVLSEFRTRLLAGHAEARLLSVLLDLCQQQGWLKAGGRQRTDSTHVLAAIRHLNRLELVIETMRSAVNTLATLAPEWVKEHAPPDWYDRYGHRLDEYRLPKKDPARRALAEQVGYDGQWLQQWLLQTPQCQAWMDLIPIQMLQQVWQQQYVEERGELRWRTPEELAPAGDRINSPHDPDARYATKRETTWIGYKAHLTEVCDADLPHVITDVHTTPAHRPDIEMTRPIQEALIEHVLAPREHLADAGYVDAGELLMSAKQRGIRLIGPTRPNSSWQANDPDAYDLTWFTIDWQAKQAICPQGKRSECWHPYHDQWGNAVITVKFARKECRPCPVRARCTHAKTAPRSLGLRTQETYEANLAARRQEQTAGWKTTYAKRAGVEGTFAQGNRRSDLRHARYIGLAKTHLQHLAIAAAVSAIRLVAWLQDIPTATTPRSPLARIA